ncbi:hypothetical protein CSB37_00415 [bacterium DOLZORAL124_38_8]|nr:MAG: hypothetical protein CSB37_00415 [bacterium DOLZORAL124_38_8]
MNTSYFAQIAEKIEAFFTQYPNGVLEILGPTASGKTGFSIRIAQHLTKKLGKPCEIISVDSRQIFKHIDIGSAKITEAEKQGIPHHGLDLKNPDKTCNAAEFQQYAFQTIEAIQNRQALPILCGGTMLWLDAISENYDFGEKGTKSTKKNPPKFPVLKIGIHWHRATLYERLNQRAQHMFENGLIEETKFLQKKFPNMSQNAFTSIGNEEVIDYLNGKISYEEALATNQQKNRKYAKRQLTWWRGRDDVFWIEGEKL